MHSSCGDVLMAMMEARNNGNVILIDDNFRNFSVVAKGTHPTNPAPVSPSGSLVALIRSGPDSPSFPWLQFGMPTSSSANFGAQAFDASGNMTFCASLKSAVVVDIIMHGGINAAPRVRNYPSGRTYATVTSLFVFTDVQTRGAGITQEYRIMRRRAYASVVGATVTAGWHEELIQDWQPVPPGGAASFPAPAYDPGTIVLDVTGY